MGPSLDSQITYTFISNNADERYGSLTLSPGCESSRWSSHGEKAIQKGFLEKGGRVLTQVPQHHTGFRVEERKGLWIKEQCKQSKMGQTIEMA